MKHYRRAAKVYKELANPVRLAIVDTINRGEMAREEIKKMVGVPDAAFAQHLHRLLNSGLIVRVKKGTREAYYRLADQGLLQLNDAAEKIYRRSYEE